MYGYERCLNNQHFWRLPKINDPSEPSEEQFHLADVHVHKGIHPTEEGKGLTWAIKYSSALGGRNIHAPISLFLPHRITEEAKVSFKSQLEMVIQHHLSQPRGHPQALTDLPSLSCCLHSPLCTRSPSEAQAPVPRPGLSLTCLPPVLHSSPQTCVICTLLPRPVPTSYPFDPDWSPQTDPGCGWSFHGPGTWCDS